MKTKVPDGMYTHEGITITPENRDSPEVKAYMAQRAEQYACQQDPYSLIAEYRRETEKVMVEILAKHDRPELREAMGWPAGGGSRWLILTQRRNMLCGGGATWAA